MELGNRQKTDMSGINNIFTGFIFILLNYRFNGFDIVPDFIGYMFIINGLKNLAFNHKFYKNAIIYAVICLIFSFFDFYQVNYPIYEVPSWFIYYTILVGLARVYINLMLYYFILFGISDIAKANGKEDISASCKFVWIWLFSLQFAAYAATVLTLFINDLAIPMIVIILIISFIIMISFLRLLKRASRELNGLNIDNLTLKTSPYKSIGKFFIIILLVIALIFCSIYLYISAKYLYTPLNMPSVLAKTFNYKYTNFLKPMSIDCQRYDNLLNSKNYVISNDSKNDLVTKEILKRADNIISLGIRDTYYNPWISGYNTIMNYSLKIHSMDCSLSIEISDDGKYIRIGSSYYQVDNSIGQEFINYLDNTFTVVIDK